jgi:hypothetical protein
MSTSVSGIGTDHIAVNDDVQTSSSQRGITERHGP